MTLLSWKESGFDRNVPPLYSSDSGRASEVAFEISARRFSEQKMIPRPLILVLPILTLALTPLKKSVAQNDNNAEGNDWPEPEEYTKVSIGAAYPLSNFGDTYKIGIGGVADFMYLVRGNFDAGARLSVRHHSFNESSLDSDVSTEGLDSYIITGFAKVDLRPKFGIYPRKYMPYVSCGIGAFNQEVSSGSISNQEIDGDSETVLGYSVGLGLRSKNGGFLEVGYLVGQTEGGQTEIVTISLGWKIF